MDDAPSDIFEDEQGYGLTEDCQLEVFVDTFSTGRDYEADVREFRDEINAFLDDHSILQYDMNVESYQYTSHGSISSKVVHEAWVLYEADGEVQE